MILHHEKKGQHLIEVSRRITPYTRERAQPVVYSPISIRTFLLGRLGKAWKSLLWK